MASSRSNWQALLNSLKRDLNAAWLSDRVVCVKAISKREFMRKPSVVSGLQPGESVVLEGKPPLVVSRPKERQITPDEIEAELDRLAPNCPRIDTLKVLKDLRR
jgi:hypothetical protein